VTLEKGPQSLFLFNNYIQQNIPRYAAGPSEFLEIKNKDGSKQNIQGPSYSFFDPSKHESVKVLEALTIETGMAVIVYELKENKTEKRIVKGPTKLFLKSNEWVHRFFWSVPDQKNPTHGTRSLQELKKN